jgi:WD40 repeat protein
MELSSGIRPSPASRRAKAHIAGVSRVSFSPDGHRAVSWSNDKTVRVWEQETGACLRTLAGHSAGVFSVSVSPDGRRAVSGSEDNTVRVWDLETGACLVVHPAGANVLDATFTPDGMRLVCGTSDGQMHFLTLVNFPPPFTPSR